MKKYFEFWNVSVIAITFILFVVALYSTGFTKNLLLEAGVFLVSIKIIMMSHRHSLSNREILKKMDEIIEKIEKTKNGL
jgi:hypothetical protein